MGTRRKIAVRLEDHQDLAGKHTWEGDMWTELEAPSVPTRVLYRQQVFVLVYKPVSPEGRYIYAFESAPEVIYDNGLDLVQ